MTIIYGLLVSQAVYSDSESFLFISALIFYAQVFIQSLYFAPLLACVNTPIKLVGFLFGLLYSCYLLVPWMPFLSFTN